MTPTRLRQLPTNLKTLPTRRRWRFGCFAARRARSLQRCRQAGGEAVATVAVTMHWAKPGSLANTACQQAHAQACSSLGRVGLSQQVLQVRRQRISFKLGMEVP
jgi:hypothetical protein